MPLPVHILHAHSTMSMLDGASPVKDYIKYAVANELGACSCTDHGWLTGAYDLINGCTKAKIKPIPGCEFYLQPLSNHQFIGEPYDYFHITVWATTMVGYRNLTSLSSHSWDGDKAVVRWGKAKPRVTFDDLMLFNEGLVVGSGCIEGPIGKCVLKGELDQARINAQLLKHIFGERLFFEVFPAVVDRDYVRNQIVQVKGEDGITYSFMPEDDIVTDLGTIKAKEAIVLQPSEVFGCTPRRVQDGEIESGGRPLLAPSPQSIILPAESLGPPREFNHPPTV